MAYQGSSGSGGYPEEHRLHDLPPSSVSLVFPDLQAFANTRNSNTIYLPMKDLMRKMNEPSCPMAKAPSMGLLMSHTLAPQLHLSDLPPAIH